MCSLVSALESLLVSLSESGLVSQLESLLVFLLLSELVWQSALPSACESEFLLVVSYRDWETIGRAHV